MTTDQSFKAEPNPTHDAPFFDSVNHVLGTGGLVTAGRRQKGRNEPLVEPDRKDEEIF